MAVVGIEKAMEPKRRLNYLFFKNRLLKTIKALGTPRIFSCHRDTKRLRKLVRAGGGLLGIINLSFYKEKVSWGY